MNRRLLSTPEDFRQYDEWIRNNPAGSIWQSLEWKRYQEALGREVRIYALLEERQILASALIVIDRTTFGFSTWDIPRGPLWGLGIGDWGLGQLLEMMYADAKSDRALSLFYSPNVPLPPTPYPLHLSSRHEQPSATRLIDLTQLEEDILRQMKPKGRYNISVAEKNGVTVEESKDVSAFVNLLKQTGQRDKFTVLSERHYAAFLRELPGSFLLLAYSSSDRLPLTAPRSPIAGLLGVVWGSKAYYYYGASDYAHRALMAPYALQWAAMRRCKALGCTSYDLLGIAPPPSPDLCSTHSECKPDTLARRRERGVRGGEGHPWQGVSTFKEKFGGTVIMYPPEQEIVLRPVMKGLLQMKRGIFG